MSNRRRRRPRYDDPNAATHYTDDHGDHRCSLCHRQLWLFICPNGQHPYCLNCDRAPNARA